MKFCFVHPFQLRLRRGIESYVWNISLALKKKGVDVEILTWQGSLAIPEAVAQAGVVVKTVPALRYYPGWFVVPFYVYHLLRNRYDQVFLHFAAYGEGPAIWLVRKLYKLSYSLVFHFPRDLVPDRYREFSSYKLERDAQHLIGVSHYVTDQIEKWANRAGEVIGYGVDPEKFQPDYRIMGQIRQDFKVPRGGKVLITLAALEERKGIQWIIQALPKVLQIYPDSVLWVLGEGKYRKALEDLVEKLGLTEHVRLFGNVPDVANYLSAADIALLLSYGEASPVSILEYMASALPVITSDKPPYDELIDSSWGIMVPPEDSTKVAEAIRSILIDETKRKNMGAAGRAYVLKNHSWKGIAQQYLDLINQ